MHDSPTFDRDPRCVNLPLVHELVDGALDDTAARRLESHLVDCPLCADEALFVRELKECASEMPRLVPGDRVWEAIAAEVGDGAVTGVGPDADPDAPAPIEWRDVERRARGRVARIAAAFLPVIGAGVLAASVGPEPAVTTLAGARPMTAGGAAHAAAPIVAETRRSPTAERAVVRQVAETPGSSETATAASEESSSLDVYRAALALENASSSAATTSDMDSDVALERERLADAETAIRQCTDALNKNPSDARVRTALYEAYEQKVNALRALIAAGERSGPSITAAPVGYGAGR